MQHLFETTLQSVFAFCIVLFCFCFLLEPTDLRIRVDNSTQIISNSIEYKVSAWWNSYSSVLLPSKEMT